MLTFLTTEKKIATNGTFSCCWDLVCGQTPPSLTPNTGVLVADRVLPSATAVTTSVANVKVQLYPTLPYPKVLLLVIKLSHRSWILRRQINTFPTDHGIVNSRRMFCLLYLVRKCRFKIKINLTTLIFVTFICFVSKLDL